jgi:cell division protein FtsQ
MKKILIIGAWLLVLSGVLTWVVYLRISHQQRVCYQVEISMGNTNGNDFVSATQIASDIYQHFGDLKGKPMHAIKIDVIEKFLSKNKYIDNVDVAMDIEGKMTIHLQQRVPLVRVYNASGASYYIDKNGYIMPLSSNYTAHVMVMNGAINEVFYAPKEKEVVKNKVSVYHSNIGPFFSLVKYIHDNEFLEAYIAQIYVRENRDIVLIPELGEHKILFGRVENIDDKFNRLRLFYKQGLNNIGWGKYALVNLKYDNQIVCTRKDAL